MNKHHFTIRTICALASLAIAGCSVGEKPIEADASVAIPLEDAQIVALEFAAKKQAEAWSKRDGAEIAENIRADLLAKRAFLLPGALPSEVRPLYEEFLAKWSAKPGAGLTFGKGSTAKFLRRMERNGHPSALIRVARPSGIFTYVELIFSTSDLGERKIVDLYFYDKGAFLSDLVRLRNLPASGVSSEVLLKSTFGADAAASLASPVKRLAEAQRDGKWKDMEDAIKAIPGKAAAHPWTVLAGISAALSQPGSTPTHSALVKTLEPIADTVEAKLLQLGVGGGADHMGQLAETAAVISLRVGGDGQAEALRAGFHAELKQWPQAQAALDQGWQIEPNLLFLYETALAISIKANDFSRACVWIDRLEKGLRVTVDPQSLNKIPGFSQLFQSREFQEWMLKNNRH